MSETTMPAAEAAVDTTDEVVSYELAFHLLPTVAEEEVKTLESELQSLITNAGGTVGLTEAAQRFDLAYELTKMIDGKYRRFETAYFGWIRFTALPESVEALMQEVEAMPAVLRSLLVRLTRQEEANPFYLHEALAARKQVTDVDVSSEAAAEPAEATPAENTETEDSATEETSEETTDDTENTTESAVDNEASKQ
jgi:ribosomal protein S6